MDDRTSGRRAVSPRYADRRGFLTASCATIALLAGCADAGPDGSGDSSAADPESADDGNAPTDDEDDAVGEGDAGAGANGDDDGETGDDETDDDETDEEDDDSGADGEDNTLEHPSAANMAHAPVLGPDSLEEGATIIMYDDPSCPACAYFEDEIFPDLESHIDAGELTIAWRGIAAIEDWSEAALQVLWATYERDADAFWDLREHLFEIQDSIGRRNDVIAEAVAYLESETTLDAEEIRSDAENGEFATRLSHDTEAASSAGLDATPYFYLFRDGEFRTEIRGAEDYRVFESALEL